MPMPIHDEPDDPVDYPREDRCRFCGAHIGWVANELGEMFALGVCDRKECQAKANAGGDRGS